MSNSKQEIVDRLKASGIAMTPEQYEVFKRLCEEFDLILVPEIEKETINK